ncbi:hypothetical protein B0H14DRAFT_2657592 [Mycena olivaceomarginata]|nr:hypothetical protein B0H14DRAFT_2657592 [Mycena olivaceomarginata]
MRTPQLHKDKCAGRRPDKGRRPWCEQGSSSKRGSKRRAGHGGHGGVARCGGQQREHRYGQRERRARRGDGKRVGALRADWARKHAPTDAHAVISTIMPREDSTRGMVSAICCWIAVRAEWTHIFWEKAVPSMLSRWDAETHATTLRVCSHLLVERWVEPCKILGATGANTQGASPIEAGERQERQRPDEGVLRAKNRKEQRHMSTIGWGKI